MRDLSPTDLKFLESALKKKKKKKSVLQLGPSLLGNFCRGR